MGQADPFAKAIDLMEQALSLLDSAGVDNPAAHLQYTVSLTRAFAQMQIVSGMPGDLGRPEAGATDRQ